MRTYWIIPLLLLTSCTYTVKVEPIHLTIDVNIKIDRALDDFFAPPPAAGAATTPALAPTPAPLKPAAK